MGKTTGRRRKERSKKKKKRDRITKGRNREKTTKKQKMIMEIKWIAEEWEILGKEEVAKEVKNLVLERSHKWIYIF